MWIICVPGDLGDEQCACSGPLSSRQSSSQGERCWFWTSRGSKRIKFLCHRRACAFRVMAIPTISSGRPGSRARITDVGGQNEGTIEVQTPAGQRALKSVLGSNVRGPEIIGGRRR